MELLSGLLALLRAFCSQPSCPRVSFPRPSLALPSFVVNFHFSFQAMASLLTSRRLLDLQVLGLLQSSEGQLVD